MATKILAPDLSGGPAELTRARVFLLVGVVSVLGLIMGVTWTVVTQRRGLERQRPVTRCAVRGRPGEDGPPGRRADVQAPVVRRCRRWPGIGAGGCDRRGRSVRRCLPGAGGRAPPTPSTTVAPPAPAVASTPAPPTARPRPPASPPPAAASVATPPVPAAVETPAPPAPSIPAVVAPASEPAAKKKPHEDKREDKDGSKEAKEQLKAQEAAEKLLAKASEKLDDAPKGKGGKG